MRCILDKVAWQIQSHINTRLIGVGKTTTGLTNDPRIQSQ